MPDSAALAALAAAQMTPFHAATAALPDGKLQAGSGGDAAALPGAGGNGSAAAGNAAATTLAAIASQRAALQGNATATAGNADDADAAQAPSVSAAQDAKPAAATATGTGKQDPLQALLAGQAGKNGTGTTTGTQGTALAATAAPGDGAKGAAQAATAPSAAVTGAGGATTAAGAKAAATDTAKSMDAATFAAMAGVQAGGTQAAQPAATAAQAAPLAVSPPLGDAQWPQALGQQMVRLTTQGSHTAELDLNPPNLGPLKVVLNVVNDQAQAQFVSPHQAVRAAVEAALPQLRTSLAESGIQLGQTSVGADSFAGQQPGNGQSQQRQASSGGFARLAGVGDSNAPVQTVTVPVRQLARGEIDTFA
ncbi:flagellar hook-length control protein FliK [Cupriavidus sp. USMAHM13]|uniref:flagellar hook-length control protein FliK n=1 Tax=Cupriavidus sp. USMAHM13 TaxID=1389192 RepID=UPI003FA46DBB